MSDSPKMEELNAPTIDSMAAFSNQLQELTDSLNLLYIRNNASGRNKFRGKWIDVALFIFGEELIKIDNEGTIDRDRRSELENLAGERRIQLKCTISEIIDKSVDKGALQFDYVGSVIDLYGAGITRFLYDEDVIERVRPGVLANLVTAQDMEDAKQAKEEAERDAVFAQNVAAANGGSVVQGYKMPLEDQQLSVEEQSILSNAPTPSAQYLSDDVLENVKPIEVDAPPEQKRELNDPMPAVPMDEELPPAAPNSEPAQQSVISDVQDGLDQKNIPTDNVIQEINDPESVEVSTHPENMVKTSTEPSSQPALSTQEAEVPLSPSSSVNPLDDIKPIDTGNTPDENLSVSAQISQKPEPVMDTLPVVEAEEVKNEVTDNVMPAVPQSTPEPVQNTAPEIPVVQPEELVSPPIAETKIDAVPTTEKPPVVIDDIAQPEPITPIESVSHSVPDPVQEIAPLPPPPEELAHPLITEPKVEEVPAEKVAKGTYVALFNAVAPIV